MGNNIGWIATAAPEDEVLKALDATKTGNRDEWFDFDINLLKPKPGWTLVLVNGLERFSDKLCEELSNNFPLLAVEVSETVMYSDARWYENGRKSWKIWHQGDEDPAHLQREGNVPADSIQIEEKKRAEQAAENAIEQDYGVDFIIEVPLELARSICGFKYDEFEEVPNACEELVSPLLKKRSFFSRFFGD